MPIGTDILIDGVNKRIYQDHAYNSGSDTEYTTQELYTLLMDWADVQANMAIPTPISAQTVFPDHSKFGLPSAVK